MRYHIIKMTRMYHGVPYCGPSSNNEPAEADTLAEAIDIANELAYNNLCGWHVVSAETGTVLYEAVKKL